MRGSSGPSDPRGGLICREFVGQRLSKALLVKEYAKIFEKSGKLILDSLRHRSRH